jgi:hypothetical protein
MDKGMDTGLPHLKIGNTVLQGEVTPLIGTEVILGLIRSKSRPLEGRGSKANEKIKRIHSAHPTLLSIQPLKE